MRSHRQAPVRSVISPLPKETLSIKSMASERSLKQPSSCTLPPARSSTLALINPFIKRMREALRRPVVRARLASTDGLRSRVSTAVYCPDVVTGQRHCGSPSPSRRTASQQSRRTRSTFKIELNLQPHTTAEVFRGWVECSSARVR